MKPEIRKELIEELRDIYREYEGAPKEESELYLEEELEDIIFEGIGEILFGLNLAGFKMDSLPTSIAKWLHNIVIDELGWDEEDKKTSIEDSIRKSYF